VPRSMIRPPSTGRIWSGMHQRTQPVRVKASRGPYEALHRRRIRCSTPASMRRGDRRTSTDGRSIRLRAMVSCRWPPESDARVADDRGAGGKSDDVVVQLANSAPVRRGFARPRTTMAMLFSSGGNRDASCCDADGLRTIGVTLRMSCPSMVIVPGDFVEAR
jgi:hypothetical protein